jgi:hypothetical protein
VVKSPSLLAACLIGAVPVEAAGAACPMELAVYLGVGNAAELEFTPSPASATVTNTFSMRLGEVVLAGFVQWSDDVARPYGMLMHDCPKGDVTGMEIAACTVWQGVIYASDMAGNIGLLPEEGENAPERLIFPDLGPSVALSAAHESNPFQSLPWDVFALKACRE